MISFNQDIATALDRAIVKITDKFLEPPIMICAPIYSLSAGKNTCRGS